MREGRDPGRGLSLDDDLVGRLALFFGFSEFAVLFFVWVFEEWDWGHCRLHVAYDLVKGAMRDRDIRCSYALVGFCHSVRL